MITNAMKGKFKGKRVKRRVYKTGTVCNTQAELGRPPVLSDKQHFNFSEIAHSCLKA